MTLRTVPGPKPQSVLAAKLNRCNLVYSLVSSIASLKSERANPASFMLRRLQTPGFLLPINSQNDKNSTKELAWEMLSVIVTALGVCNS